MRTNKNQIMPLARQEGLIVVQLNDEVLIYDLEHHKAHCLNPIATRVWQGCDGKHTLTQISARVGAAENASLDTEVVRLAIIQLERARLLMCGSSGRNEDVSSAQYESG